MREGVDTTLMTLSELKKKLRDLKKYENKLRFSSSLDQSKNQYIWCEFFSTQNPDDDFVRYNMSSLLKMSRTSLKEVYEEFFYHLYIQYYRENGWYLKEMQDLELLNEFGLPLDASLVDIKKKFRELAKIHHPDSGGDEDAFIKLYESYEKLIDWS